MNSSIKKENIGRKRAWRVLWLILVFSLPGLVVLLTFRALLFQPYFIPSPSNEPNLVVGDYIIVSKYPYGYSRYSFPASIASFSGRIWFRSPQRGDVVIFKYPLDTKVDYVKRIVGLPGDRLQMKNGVVWLNGVALRTMPESVDSGIQRLMPDAQFFRETLPEGRSYVIASLQDEGPADNTTEYVVPPRHYFVLGDNRDNSSDSRFLNRVGYVPEENLVGRFEFIFLNLNSIPVAKRP